MIIRVAPSLPTMKTFLYRVPEGWERFLGRFTRVKIHLSGRPVTGFVLSEENEQGIHLKSIEEIKGIEDIFPLLDGPLGELCLWASKFYITPIGMVLKFALSYGLDVEPYLRIRSTSRDSLHLDGALLSKAIKENGREGILRYFYDRGIELIDIFTGVSFLPSGTSSEKRGRNNKRLLYISDFKERIEFYAAEIERRIGQNRNCLLLMPDYQGLGDFFYNIFQKRFKDRVLWFGSKVQKNKRMEAYFKARKGGYLIFGNKSSVFLPGMKEGLIIVERPEDILKNIEGFRFDATKIAIERSFLEDVDVIFGSISPPIDVFQEGKEGVFEMVDQRKAHKKKHEIIIDHIPSGQRGMLSKRIADVIEEAIKQREVIGIYTPKKIYGTSVRCILCEESILCRGCGASLSFNKEKNVFFCKACGIEFEGLIKCPGCGGELIYTPFLGVESIEEQLNSMYKGTEVYSCTGENLKKTLKALQKKTPDKGAIIVGSQALTKLCDVSLKRLILIGWESIPLFAGYRAYERMFQTLQNLIDGTHPGILYFFMEREMAVDPFLYLDLHSFYEKELMRRKSALFPPYTRLFSIEIEHPSERDGLKKVERIVSLIKDKGLEDLLSGPVKERYKGYYRWRFLLKGEVDKLYDVFKSIYDIKGVKIEADPPHV
ncbi:MAG: hypothetical protein N2745_06005 [Syntrophorhabdaceae bacterium]|nr:hypothetical protein [Syntrophorhabdaceae bacterium]